MHSSHDRIGTSLANTWLIERELGSGGMATVYAAKHHRNGRQVAVKVLHAQVSREPEVVHRFTREGYLANAVNHSGVARIYDDGVTDDGCAFLIMDLLEGETLETSRLARRRGRLPVNEALSVVRDVLGVLAAAHDRKISHRDVKPDNVFLTSNGEVKLLDFGIASMAKHSTTSLSRVSTGVGWGTPQFMAPEQVLGTASCGPHVDVWAVAVMFFKLVTGKYPFNATNLTDLIEAHQTKPPMLDSMVNEVSTTVAEVFDRAFTFHPAGRFADAGEMARALDDAVSTASLPSLSSPSRSCFSTTLVLATVPRIRLVETPPNAPVVADALVSAMASSSSRQLGTATTVREVPAPMPMPMRTPLPPPRHAALQSAVRRESSPSASYPNQHPLHSQAQSSARSTHSVKVDALRAPSSIMNQPRAVIGLLVVSIATFVSSAAYSLRVNAMDSSPTTITTTTTAHTDVARR